jgi:hypothetical protein
MINYFVIPSSVESALKANGNESDLYIWIARERSTGLIISYERH